MTNLMGKAVRPNIFKGFRVKKGTISIQSPSDKSFIFILSVLPSPSFQKGTLSLQVFPLPFVALVSFL